MTDCVFVLILRRALISIRIIMLPVFYSAEDKIAHAVVALPLLLLLLYVGVKGGFLRGRIEFNLIVVLRHNPKLPVLLCHLFEFFRV